MRKSSLIILIVSCLFSQVDMNFSLETKYGDGYKITSLGSATPDTSDYRYFENILDINTIYQNNLYMFLQLEYSDPPIYGFNLDGVNAFYLEYNQDKLNMKAGDLYTMYGRGMSFRTFQDQNIDFDNSLKGLELNYDIHDRIRLFALLGQGTYYYRGNPAVVVPDRSLKNNAILFGTEFFTDNFGDFTIFYFENDQELSENLIFSYEGEISDNRLSRELFSRISYQDVREDTVKFYNRTMGWNKSFKWIDIYLEKAWNNYTKILGERVDGSMFYAALSTDIFDTGISYEYKNYDMPYFIQSLSNPPTVSREPSSVLASRNSHQLSFGDEIGHQIEVNREFLFGSHLLANLSLSNRHKGFLTEDYTSFSLSESGGVFSGQWQVDSTAHLSTKNPSFIDIMSFSGNDDVKSHYPYRQFYVELSGWQFNDKFYYKIGVDQYDEITKYHDQINYIPVNNMTDDSLQDYLSGYYYDYYWDIWDDYYTLSNFNETLANFYFEMDYGAPVDTAIISAVNSTFSEVSPILNSLSQSEKNYEKVSAFTIPSQIAFDVNGIGAFTVYVEKQWKKIAINRDVLFPNGEVDNSLSQRETYKLNYYSLSYRHPWDLSVTLFYETESYKRKLGGVNNANHDYDWLGVDLSCDINDNSQLSLFFGSQKGGRVCANGICADLPGFEDGIKITFISIF